MPIPPDEIEVLLQKLREKEAQESNTASDLPAKVGEVAPVEEPKNPAVLAKDVAGMAAAGTKNWKHDQLLKDAGVAEHSEILVGANAEAKIAKGEATGDGDRGVPLNDAEKAAVAAAQERRADVEDTAEKAKLEEETPTAAKLPLRVIAGVTEAFVEPVRKLVGGGVGLGDSKIPKVGGTVGDLTDGLSQGAAGFGIAGKLLKVTNLLQKAGKVTTLARAKTVDSIAGSLSFDPYKGNIADILAEVPELRPVVEGLVVNQDDPAWLAYGKNVLQEMGVGTAADGLMAGLRGTVKVRKAYLTGGKKAADEELKVVSQEIDAALESSEWSNKVKEIAPDLFPASYRFNGSPPTLKEIEALRKQVKAEGITKVDPEAVEMLLDLQRKSASGDESGTAALAALTRNIKGEANLASAPKKAVPLVNPDVTPAPKEAKLSDTDLDEIIGKATLGSSPTGKPPTKPFNLNTWDTSDNAVRTIDAVASQLEGKVKGWTEVQTQDMVTTTAKELALDPSELWETLARDGDSLEKLSSRIVAYRSEIKSQADIVTDKATKLAAGVIDQTEFDEAAQSMANWMTMFKKVQQGSGRALQSFNIRPFSAQEIRAIAMTGGDVSKIRSIMDQRSVVRRVFDAGIAGWMNSILSGVRTMEANLVTNTGMTYLQPLERIAGGVLTNNSEATFKGMAQLFGLHRFYGDSLAMAKMSFDFEAPFLDRMSKADGNVSHDLSSKGLGIPEGSISNGMDHLFTVARTPMRTLTATDELYKQLNFRASMHAELLYEGFANQGLRGVELMSWVDETFKLGFDDAGKALTSKNHAALVKVYKIVGEELGNKIANMGDSSLKGAQDATFTTPLSKDTIGGSIGRVVQDASEALPPLRLINPFVRTPTNILRQAGMRLPAGLNFISKQMRADWEAGGVRRADAIGKTATAQMLWGASALAVTTGVITGGGPANPEARARLEATGWRPYSVKVDGKFIPYGRKEPFSYILGMAADFSEVSAALPESDINSLGAAMVFSVQKNITSSSYLKGMSNFLELLTNGVKIKSDGGVVGVSGWNRMVQSYANSLVPAILEDSAAIMGMDDPYQREVRSMMDSIKEGTPFFSSSLEPRRDVFGRPLVNTRNSPMGVFNSTNWGSENGDVTMQELAKLGGSVGAVPQKIEEGLIDLTKYKNEKGQSAFDRAGQMRAENDLKGRFDAIIGTEGFQALPPSHPKVLTDRENLVQKLFREEHKNNMSRLQSEFPKLRDDLIKLSRAKDLIKSGKTDDGNALLSALRGGK